MRPFWEQKEGQNGAAVFVICAAFYSHEDLKI